MTTEDQHRRLSSIFTEAMQQPPAKRESFIVEAAGDDPDLLRELRSLLAADESASPVLDLTLTEADNTNTGQDRRDLRRNGGEGLNSVLKKCFASRRTGFRSRSRQ